MREIKFRAWNKVWKCMYYLTGFRLVGKKHIQLYYIDEDGDSTTCTVLLENIILMQYTGLSDKNCNEIYECDECEVYKTCVFARGFIKFHKGCFIFQEYKTGNILRLSDMKLNGYAIKVIGMAIDNPELMEVYHG
jgi:uncharacterized phage protein (TIGR01671 family)